MWMPSMMGRIYRNTLHNESQGGSCTFFLSMYSFKSEISRLTFFGLNLASVFYSYVVPDSGKLVSWGCLLNPWKPVYPFASSLAGLYINFKDVDLFSCSKIGHLKISRLEQIIDSF